MPNSYPLIYKIAVITYYLQNKCDVKDLLNIFNISKSSLYNWLKQYNENILSEKKKYNKVSKYTSDIKIYIKTYVIKRKIFSYKRLIHQLYKKYKLKTSKSSIYEILKNMKVSHKKLKKKMIYGNKLKLKEKRKQFRKIINKTDLDNIICIDETSIDTRMLPLYGWASKGEKVTHTVNAYKSRYTIICAISNKKVIYYEIIKNSVDKIKFKQFLENLFNKNISNKKIVLDNACIHHSKLVKEYLDTTTNEFIFNAPYTPEYNPIEQLFSKLKLNIRKHLDNNYKKLMKTVKSTFKNIKSVELSNYYRKSFSF